MSLTPDIVNKIIQGMRFNLKGVVLPALENKPYPTGQAVSTYVLLKSLAGYTSPQFRDHILESNREMRDVLEYAKKKLLKDPAGGGPEFKKWRDTLEDSLRENIGGGDPLSEFYRLAESITILIKVLWEEFKINADIKMDLRGKINTSLRNQLNRELEVLA
jgi:hypothetical protein